MSLRRRFGAAAGAAAMLAFGALPASASTNSAPSAVGTQLLADGGGVAFALRPTYDAGGANPLSLYIGYAEANLSSPEPSADGEAAWYQLNIVETAAFQPPENCTPDKNLAATENGAADVQAWLTGYLQQAAGQAAAGRQPSPPIAPGPRHPCTERFAGFAQSRYPATGTIDQHATDDYLDKPTAADACRQDPSSSQCRQYRQYWPMFRALAGKAVRDGSFGATSTPAPSQVSDALLFGAGDGATVSIGLAHVESTAHVEGNAVVTESSSTLHDICILPAGGTCTLRIDSMRQYAKVTTPASGAAVREASTTVTGVHGTGVAKDLTADDLMLAKGSIDLGGYFRIDAVSATHACDQGDGVAPADAGGIRLYGKGSSTTFGGSPSLTIPGGGGGIMIGGACARAEASTQTIALPVFNPASGVPGVPGSTPSIPGAPGPPPLIGPPAVAPQPQVVLRSLTRIEFRRPIAWRTAKYWARALAALMLLAVFGFAFRRSKLVAPVARRADLFARQFLRG